eukprot:10368-Pyramimonas_sp.AAC.1
MLWDYLCTALLTQQCGGLPGRLHDVAAHVVKMLWGAAAFHKLSACSCLIDLTAAFYSTIQQLACDLPGEAEAFDEALNSMKLPAILSQGTRVQLAQRPLFQQRVGRFHALARLRGGQRG